jgi:hypothetical protein
MIRKDFKYKVIKNFLSEEEKKLLKTFTILETRLNKTNFDPCLSSTPNLGDYSATIMESLLLNKKELMEKETELKLHPTYSFWRMYTAGSNLFKHKDRESCEISCTVNIGSCGTPWPIFMDDVPVTLETGDAAIYLGREVKHWREEFQGDWNAQVFLHYVDKNGPYADFHMDKRVYFGINGGINNQ